jgi:hypothetical protein
VVFTDMTLAAIAERQPRDEAELLDIPGIGPAKYELYGEVLLAMVADSAPGGMGDAAAGLEAARDGPTGGPPAGHAGGLVLPPSPSLSSAAGRSKATGAEEGVSAGQAGRGGSLGADQPGFVDEGVDPEVVDIDVVDVRG